MNHLKLIALKDFPLIQPKDDLASIITKSIHLNKITIEPGDVIVIAQKVISKSEDRFQVVNEIEPSQEAIDLAKELKRDPSFIQIILNESNKIISTEKNVIIVEHKLGFININAGLDRSNISQERDIVLLLPENPSKSAEVIQTNLSNQLNKKLSVIISDSMTRPYRSGVINFALASSNIQSLIDLKGENDMYGNKLKGTEIAVADELASAAGLLMGQSDEKKPIVLIKGFNKSTYEVNNAFDLIMNENEDLYR